MQNRSKAAAGNEPEMELQNGKEQKAQIGAAACVCSLRRQTEGQGPRANFCYSSQRTCNVETQTQSREKREAVGKKSAMAATLSHFHHVWRVHFILRRCLHTKRSFSVLGWQNPPHRNGFHSKRFLCVQTWLCEGIRLMRVKNTNI